MNSKPASPLIRGRRRFPSSSRLNRVKSITIPYSIVALALLTFTSLLLTPSSLPAQDQREIWVPTDHLDAVLKKMPKAVLLTPEQYEQLREEFQQSKIDPDKDAIPPPVSAVIRSAEYRGTIQTESDVVFVEVSYEIECFTDEWTEVPLLLPREHLGYVVIDADTALRVTPDGKKKNTTPPLLLTHGKGTHRVEANYHIPITRLPNGNLIKIKSPGVPASLTLSLPDGSDLESELPFVREEGSAIFALPSERGKDHEIRWSARKVAAIPGAAVFQSCSYLYSLDSTSLQADLAMVINSALTDLPTHYDIEIPKEFRVLSVEGEELLRWTRNASGVVAVDLVPGDRDTTDIRLRVERDVPEFDAENPDVELTLPIASVQGIHRASGTMTLLGSDDIRVKKIATGPLTIPIPDDAEGPAVNLPHYIASFRFPVSTEAPKVTLSKIRSRYKAQLDTLISLEREAINLTRTLTVIPLEGMLFSLATQLSPDEEIIDISVDGEEEESGFDWTADDDNRILMTWDSGLTRESPATLTIETRRDPEGWFALGNEPMDLAFSHTYIEDVEAVSGYLAVAFDESFQVETLATTGLESRDARTTPVSGTLAWFRLDEFDLQLAARRRAPEIEASLVSYALPLANTVEIEGQIDLDIRFSGIEELAVTFPEDVASLVRFDSPLIAEQTLDDDGSTWTLRFHQERKGAARIRFSLILPFEAKTDPSTGMSNEGTFGVALPRIGIPEAKRIHGDWVMEANTDTELDFRAEGLDRVDSLQVPTVAGYQARHRIIAAFRYRGDEWSLELNGTRHPHSEVVTAVVDSLQLDTVVSVDGADRHQAQLAMRSTGEQFLELQLPPEAIVWTLLVDDETVKPVRAGEDTLRVQLPAHEDANRQIRIHLIYQTPGKEWRGSGKEKLVPIRLADRIPVMRTQWFLHLPEGYDYQKFKTNLGQEFEVVDRLLLGEAAKKFGDDLSVIGSAGYAFKSEVASPMSPQSDMVSASESMISVENESQADGLDREHAREEFVKEVAEGWEMPVPGGVSLGVNIPSPTDSSSTAMKSVEDSLNSIIIPSVEFNDTPLKDALEFLGQRSVELDVSESDPAKKGVNIVLDTGGPTAGMAPPPTEPDPFGPKPANDGGFGFEGGGGIGDTRITLRLTNVPLSEALRYTTSLAQLKYKVEPNAVVVVPISTPDQDLYTNVYNVPPDFLSAGTIAGGGGAAADPFAAMPEDIGGGVLGGRRTAKDILESAGITFSPGSSAIYNAETGQLIVRNTEDQMELVEQLGGSIDPGNQAYAQIGHGGYLAAGGNKQSGAVNIESESVAFIAGGQIEDKVPFLGDLPQIGRLFESSEKIGNENEQLLRELSFDDLDLEGRTLQEAATILNTKLAEAAGDEFPAARSLSIQVADGDGESPAPGKKLDFTLGKVTVLEALDKLTGATNTHYRVTASGILIAPADTPLEPMESVFIPLPASKFQTTDAEGEPKQTHARQVLLAAGIEFPPGSSAAYNPVSGRLAVKNTRTNLEAIVSLYADDIAGAHSASSGDKGKPDLADLPLGGATELRGFDYRDIGKRPLKFALPESGRSYRFSGLYAPDELTFRFVNWERQIRFAWIWMLVGGLVFWFIAWRKLEQPVFLGIAGIIALTFIPLLVTASLSAFCNALLIGWVAAMLLGLIYHISRKVVRSS